MYTHNIRAVRSKNRFYNKSCVEREREKYYRIYLRMMCEYNPKYQAPKIKVHTLRFFVVVWYVVDKILQRRKKSDQYLFIHVIVFSFETGVSKYGVLYI